MTWRASRLLHAFIVISGVFAAAPVAAQDPLGWNGPRALELMDRARIRRDLPRGDSTLENYTAKANGFVYFYLDRRETDDRTLVKVDQIAIDLYWKNPDRTKQRIVGLRDVSRLPNRMYYHLDHLTVVQNGFGDVIKVGDGDEVRDVPHPAASGGDTIYDFRLADSVTLQLGGDQGTVRVYEIQVRPKRTDRSALIGSVFVDRATADIVRLTFTFTPASYVDRRLDYINISLDNGLFAGRYWLPAEQSVEIRRQLPELDFAAGAVIKGRVRVGSYEFNQPLSDTLFWGRPVSAVPEAQRRSYEFPVDIFSDINEAGLSPTPRMEELQELAAELVGKSRLSGLPPIRLFVPDASSVVRYNRAEGWYGGLGASYVTSPGLRFDALAGYAFGAEHSVGLLQMRVDRNATRVYVMGELNALRDVGPTAGMPGVLNTIAGRLFNQDYLDPYYVDGLALRVEQRLGKHTQAHFRVAAEDHSSATLTQDASEFQPVLAINDGRVYELTAGVLRALPETAGLRWGSSMNVDVARFDDEWSMRPRFELRLQYDTENKSTSLLSSVRASAPLSGDLPAQYHALIGGRETLPGYAYRAFGGDSYVLINAEATRSVWEPWVRLRAFAAFGVTDLNGGGPSLRPTTDPVFGGGAGVSLFWDVLRFDVAYGDKWRTIFSIQPNLRDIL